MALHHQNRARRMFPVLLTIVAALAAAGKTSAAAVDCPQLDASRRCVCSGRAGAPGAGVAAVVIDCDRLEATHLDFLRPAAASVSWLSAVGNRLPYLGAALLDGAANLTFLDLSHNQINGSDGQFFVSLTALRTLNLSHNELETFYLPGNVLLYLERIILDHNALVRVKFEHRPSPLRVLSLFGNKLSDLNDSFPKNIVSETLNLTHNIIGNNLNFLENVTKIATLWLGYNNISKISKRFICDLKLRDLMNLWLDGNRLTDVEFLNCTGSLWRLNISNNFISVISENVFDKNNILYWLYVANNELTDTSFLKHMARDFQVLDLSSNKISYINPDYFKSKTQQMEIYVSHNQLQSIAFASYAVNLRKLIAHNNKISRIEDSTFQKNSRLSVLNLNDNFISNEKFLTYLPNLSILSLQHNNISAINQGAVSGLKELETLDLSSNRISDASFVKAIPSLRSLNLSYNKIEKSPCNDNVEYLYLDGNDIRELEKCTPKLRTLTVYNSLLREKDYGRIGESNEIVLEINNENITLNCTPSIDNIRSCLNVCSSINAKVLSCDAPCTGFLCSTSNIVYSIVSVLVIACIGLFVVLFRKCNRNVPRNQCTCDKRRKHFPHQALGPHELHC